MNSPLLLANQMPESLSNQSKAFVLRENTKSTCRTCPQKVLSTEKPSLPTYLNNYFDFHVCLSIHPSVVPDPCFRPSNLTSTPASVSQNGLTNKSCLLCIKSEKYASWVTLRPQWDRCRRGKAEVHLFDFKTKWSEFHCSLQGEAEVHII